jgi:hypothetical protein
MQLDMHLPKVFPAASFGRQEVKQPLNFFRFAACDAMSYLRERRERRVSFLWTKYAPPTANTPPAMESLGAIGLSAISTAAASSKTPKSAENV